MDLVTVKTQHVPSQIHSGLTEVLWELLARKPAAVTYVSSNVTFTEYPNLIKRYSDLWYELLHESVVSSDTAGNALGLNGINSSKIHFKQYVKDEQFMESHTQVTYSQCELNGLASLCATFASALLPSCAVFSERDVDFMMVQIEEIYCHQHITEL